MTEFCGWCSRCGVREVGEVIPALGCPSLGCCTTCGTGCTGHGAEAALAAIRERDELRAALLDCRKWVEDSETWESITENLPKGWDK